MNGSDTPMVELKIEGLAAGGRGVARRDGKVWFVREAVPGDRVLARPLRERPSYVEAVRERLLSPAPDRREAACPHQDRCGGCPWMVLPEPVQRHWKRQLLLDALRRIGGLAESRVEEAIAGAPLAYRNRVEFTLGRDTRGGHRIGLHGPGGEELVEVDACAVQHPAADRVLATVRAFLRANGERDSAVGARIDEPPRLILRRSWHCGEILVVLREVEVPFPRAEALAEHLAASHEDVCGVVRVRARERRRGGSRWECLAGRPWLEERIAGLPFRLGPVTFTQVNPEMAARLVELVSGLVGELAGATLLDLYGGVGVFGLSLAGGSAATVVCEADPDAVRCGREAAGRLGRPAIEFVRADVGSFLRERIAARRGSHAVVANPPRTGLGPGVARGLSALAPARIVVVSCDPPTLARDARQLIDGGYTLQRVVPIDMFPQTAHVESVALFERRA